MSGAQNRLNHFPISFFSMIMGLMGLTIAWQKAQHVFAVDLSIDPVLLALTSSAFVALSLIYATNASFHMYELTHKLAYQYVGSALLTLLTAVVVFLLYKTAIAVKNQKICVEEH